MSPEELRTIPGKVLQPISLISRCRGTAVRERTVLFSVATTSVIFLWPQRLIKGHYYVCLVGTLRNMADRIMHTGWLPGLDDAPASGPRGLGARTAHASRGQREEARGS